MAKFKVLDVKDYIHLICIKDNAANTNPYRLYLVYNAKHETYGYYTERKKLIGKYGNIQSILCHIADLYNYNVQYYPVHDIIAWNQKYYNG